MSAAVRLSNGSWSIRACSACGRRTHCPLCAAVHVERWHARHKEAP